MQARCDSLRAALDPAVDTLAVQRYVAAWAARSQPLSPAERAALNDTVRAVYEGVEAFYAGLPAAQIHPLVLALQDGGMTYNVVRDRSTADTLRFLHQPGSPTDVIFSGAFQRDVADSIVATTKIDTFRPNVQRPDSPPVVFVKRMDAAAAECYLAGPEAESHHAAIQRLDTLRWEGKVLSAADSALLRKVYAWDDERRVRTDRLTYLVPYMSHFGPPTFHQYPFAYAVTLDEPLRRAAVWSDDGQYYRVHFFLRTPSGWRPRGERVVGGYIE